VICRTDIPGITGGALDSNEGAPGPIMCRGIMDLWSTQSHDHADALTRESLPISALLAVALAPASARAQRAAAPLDAATAGRFAALALACVQQEIPNKISHILFPTM